MASYPRDVAAALGYVINQSGIAGVEAQNRSKLVGQLAGRAFRYIMSNPGEVANRLGTLISNNKAQFAGRIGTGPAISVAGGPIFGGGMTTLSAFGGAINALNGVANQLEAGNINTNSISNETWGTIAGAGILGASVSFNTKTGDVTATMRTTPTGSRIERTISEKICNVNSERGC